MLKPVNKHLLIAPVPHDSFIASQKGTFQEIGKVVAIAPDVASEIPVEVGHHVYFDSWLVAQYPNEEDRDNPYWLVKWEDVRGYVE